ncbi:hypothetical protein C427_1818 [Paraglaciecola psychrophila 170]|uniref:Uncharacterized protein n=1 Tax=Paraglaciecola psychrophila 170 TaxID=1129794 RepID=K7A4P3_9ALTE|nr:hypothetical protein C427_1818 [Paraglaciecola psychrophila 170]GAC37327.1 hypothetical protein GPSY_1698 [Paraglaciecola psychrophila 170]
MNNPLFEINGNQHINGKFNVQSSFVKTLLHQQYAAGRY